MAEPEMVQVCVEFSDNIGPWALSWALMDPRLPKIVDRGKCKKTNWVIVQVLRADVSDALKKMQTIAGVSRVHRHTPPPKTV